MKNIVILTFLIASLSSTAAFAQVENEPVKGAIPFELREHLIVIEGKINGSAKSYSFVLDTGGLTFVDQKVAEELGLKIRGNMAKMDTLDMGDVSISNDTISLKAMVDTGQPYSVVLPLDHLDSMGLRDDPSLVRSKGVMIEWPGTKTKDVYLGRIGRWTQGGNKIQDLMCLFAELPASLSVPLLGKEYLSRFLMTIDYPNHEILFVPYEDASFVKDLFSFGLNLGKGENNTIIVDGLWAGGPSDNAGIKVGEEIIACNGRPFNGDRIFQLRQLISDETVKDVKLLVKNEETRREVLLRKGPMLSRERR